MTRFSVPDMTCGHCKAAIEKAVSAISPAAVIKVDLENHIVEIESTTDDATLVAAMKDEGYEATPTS